MIHFRLFGKHIYISDCHMRKKYAKRSNSKELRNVIKSGGSCSVSYVEMRQLRQRYITLMSAALIHNTGERTGIRWYYVRTATQRRIWMYMSTTN